MRLRHGSPLVALLAAVLLSTLAPGARHEPAKRPTRTLLYPARVEDVPEALRPHVARLLSPDQKPLAPADAKPNGTFARVVALEYALDGKSLKKGGTLGTRPFVFVTLPEALYGRSLLDVFATIGYSADDILAGEVGRPKALLVFRWGKEVVLHEKRDEALPERWHNAVYPATWGNLFALVERMVADKDCHYVHVKGGPRHFDRLELRSEKEAAFVTGFPDAGKKRLQAVSYAVLREVGGADWEYRAFLERSMAAAEHYTGDGTIKVTLAGRGAPGFPEFLGPNRELTALPEVAVIGLGTLRVGE